MPTTSPFNSKIHNQVLDIPDELPNEMPLLEKENEGKLLLTNKKDSPIKRNDEQDLSIFVMILYSLPAFTKMAALVIFNVHIILLYKNLGANLLIISFFIAITRTIEIIFKPAIALFSDRYKSKYGRRKPFMFVGCLFYSSFLIALFYPPTESSSFLISLWFGVIYILFFIFDTICNIPYAALGPELSESSTTREKLYFIFFLIQYLGVISAVTLPIFFQLSIYNSCDLSQCDDDRYCIQRINEACNDRNNFNSVRLTCTLIAIWYSISTLLIGLFIKEKYSNRKDKEGFNEERSASNSLLPSIYSIMNNKVFLSLVNPYIIDNIILYLFASMFPFYIKYVISPEDYCFTNDINESNIICQSSLLMGSCMMIFFVSMIFYMIIWHFLVLRFGKKTCWRFSSLIGMFLFFIFFFCSSNHPYYLLIQSSVISITASCAYLNDVFISDIIDYDELKTGFRNEGIYTVFSSFVPKLVSIFAQAIPISILSIVGLASDSISSTSSSPSPSTTTSTSASTSLLILNTFLYKTNNSIYSYIESNTTAFPHKDTSKDREWLINLIIKVFFIVIPSILSLLNFYLKKGYLIESHKDVEKIRKKIKIKEFYIKTKLLDSSLNNEKQYSLLKLTDPILNVKIFCINENSKKTHETQRIINHFWSFDDLKLIYKNELMYLKQEVKINLVIAYTTVVSSVIFIIFTFNLLENSVYSFIPFLFLLVFAFGIIYLIINQIRFNLIKKMIFQKVKLDRCFLLLYLFKYLEERRQERNIVCEEMIDMTHGINNESFILDDGNDNDNDLDFI